MPDLSAADVVALTTLVNRYGHLVDDAAWDDLGLVFTADAVVDFSPLVPAVAPMHGLDAIRATFAAAEHPMAHLATNVVVEPGPELGTARIRSKLLVIRRDGRPLVGEYRDRAVRTPAGWRLVERNALPPPSRPRA